jgi:hypothetical protein
MTRVLARVLNIDEGAIAAMVAKELNKIRGAGSQNEDAWTGDVGVAEVLVAV